MGDTINFRNQAQVILWKEELCGQLGQNEAWYSVGRADGYKTMCKFLKEIIEL